MDTLTSLLHGLNLRAKLIYAGGVCGRWAINHNSETDIWFHLLTKGDGWVHSPAWQAPLPLAEGDLILFLPHAEKHYLSYSPDELNFNTEDARTVPWRQGSSGFVCGLIELGMPKAAIWRALPPEIIIRKQQAGEPLIHLIRLMITESGADRFGNFALIEHLCDSIFVLVLRYCIEQQLVKHGVLVAMRDSRLEAVLNLLHSEPWRPWSLLELCRHAGLSKSALTKKFVTLLGSPPMEYLTLWRMQIAAGWLKESGMTIERVAERCGYDSVSAFSRAFKRCFGVSPGGYRTANSGIEHPLIPTQASF